MSLPLRFPEEATPLLAALTRSPDPVFVTDRHNRIVFWNQSASRLLGYAAEEILGQPCARVLQGCDLYGNRYCSDVCPVTQIATRNEPVRRFDLRLRGKDQSTLVAEIHVLNLALEAPDHFLLVHTLRPAEPAEATARPTEESFEPPRPALTAVRESTDARARATSDRATPREKNSVQTWTASVTSERSRSISGVGGTCRGRSPPGWPPKSRRRVLSPRA